MAPRFTLKKRRLHGRENNILHQNANAIVSPDPFFIQYVVTHCLLFFSFLSRASDERSDQKKLQKVGSFESYELEKVVA